jgi:hypothetical protein
VPPPTRSLGVSADGTDLAEQASRVVLAPEPAGRAIQPAPKSPAICRFRDSMHASPFAVPRIHRAREPDRSLAPAARSQAPDTAAARRRRGRAVERPDGAGQGDRRAGLEFEVSDQDALFVGTVLVSRLIMGSPCRMKP